MKSPKVSALVLQNHSSLSSHNLECALQHPNTVTQYLADEIMQYHVAGLFQRSTIPEAPISRFGVIPKNHQPDKWHLIIDLSHAAGRNINNGIPKKFASLHTSLSTQPSNTFSN